MPNVPRTELRKIIAKKYKCGENCVVFFGFKTAFGGMSTTGFCLIYDNLNYLKKYEPKYRQARVRKFFRFLE